MTKVIDFNAYLQSKKNSSSSKLASQFSEHDLNLLYELINGAAEWFHTDDGNDFWIDEMYISHTIEMCSMMIKECDQPTEEVLKSFLGHVRFLTDFMSNCVDDPTKYHAIALEIAKAFEPTSGIPHDMPSVAGNPIKKQSYTSALLSLTKTKRWSANELAKTLGKSEHWVRGAITCLRKKGYKIVNFPVERTFGFEEGVAPPMGPAFGGDDRWKRWA